jgi:hypothetical protein
MFLIVFCPGGVAAGLGDFTDGDISVCSPTTAFSKAILFALLISHQVALQSQLFCNLVFDLMMILQQQQHSLILPQFDQQKWFQ